MYGCVCKVMPLKSFRKCVEKYVYFEDGQSCPYTTHWVVLTNNLEAPATIL
jgi:hypothetical protein